MSAVRDISTSWQARLIKHRRHYGFNLSAQDNLQGFSIQKRLGQKFLKLIILCFNVLQSFGIWYCHPTKLGAPGVKRR